jgi:drug/metabolite transporter (DMT)-like permease
MDWVLFAISAAIVWAGVNLLDKFVMDNEISDFVVAGSVCGISIFFVQSLATLALFDISLDGLSILFGLVTGTIYTGGLVAYYYGIKEEDVSRFIPTTSLGTVFVVILSFIFLSESFTPLIYVGIASTVAGAFLISLEDPIHDLERFQSGRATLLALLAASMFASRDVIFKFATFSFSEWSIIFWMGIGGIFCCAILLVWKKDKLKGGRKGEEHLVLIGVFTALGYFLMARAISIGPVSLVSATLKTQMIVVFLASVILSRFHPGIVSEDTDRTIIAQKFLALILIILGVVGIQLL